MIRTLPSDDVAEALAVWESLEKRVDTESMATSSLWTENWIRHYGDLVSYEFVVAEADSVPQGICLLTSSRHARIGPLTVRSVHVGTAGEPEADSPFVEHNRLLVHPERRVEFCRRLVELVRTDRRWDQFQLDGFDADAAAPLLESVAEFDVERRESPYFDLQATREQEVDVLSQLGRSTRGNIRRRLRDYGELCVEWVESLDVAEEVFSEIVSLHQARWAAAGRPGAFASRRFHDFQLDLIARGLLERRVVLFRVRTGGDTLGCLLLLVDDNRLLDYVSGFASFNKYASPGLIVHSLCMQEALRRGYDAYDFLAGEHRHKRNLSTHSAELVWATARRDRWKFRAAAAAKRVRDLTRGRSVGRTGR